MRLLAIKRALAVLLPMAIAFFLVRLAIIHWSRAQLPLTREPVEQAAGIPKELDTLDLRILNFYAASNPVRGEPFALCYGVLNAVSLKMEPPLAELSPSLSRCVEVKLLQETELKLVAAGRNGEEQSASFRLGVREPRPEFLFVSVSARQLQRGEKFAICFGVKNAARVSIEHGGPHLVPGPKVCAMWYPTEPPGKLIAESPGGKEIVTLPVKITR